MISVLFHIVFPVIFKSCGGYLIITKHMLDTGLVKPENNSYELLKGIEHSFMKRDLRQQNNETGLNVTKSTGNTLLRNNNSSTAGEVHHLQENFGVVNSNSRKVENEKNTSSTEKEIFSAVTRRCKKIGDSKCLTIRSEIGTFEPINLENLEGKNVGDHFQKFQKSPPDVNQFAAFNGEKILLKSAPRNNQNENNRFNYFLEPHYNKEKTQLDPLSNQFYANGQRFQFDQNADAYGQDFKNHQTENELETKMTSSANAQDGRNFYDQPRSDEGGMSEQQLNDTIWNNVRDNIFSSLQQLYPNGTESTSDQMILSHELCNFQDYIFSSSPNCAFGQLIYNLVEETSFALRNQNFSERNLIDAPPESDLISGRRKASLKYITFLLGVLVVKLLIVLPLVILTAGKSIALSLLSLGVATANVFQNKHNLPYMKRRDEISPFSYDKFTLGPHSFR